MRRRVFTLVVAALLIGGAGIVQAQGQPISQVVVLGDSLSDNGNFYAATGLPPAPYWQGRQSNGPVTVEYLALRLGVPLVDFAWIGATTGVGNFADGGTVDTFGIYTLPGITTVFQQALALHQFPLDPDALYVVWGGPNDFWAVTNSAEAQVAIAKAVTNLVTIVGQLQALGAKRILVMNMPDLGKTPLFLAAGPSASNFATQLTLAFDQALMANLPPGVHYFDTFAWLSSILANPGAYGFTNVTDQCFTGSSLCANPDQYFFFDDVHPTTTAHTTLADAVYRSVAPTVLVGTCDSGSPNPLLEGGSTVADLIAHALYAARNHGQFVSSVAKITNGLVAGGLYSGAQKDAVQGCAARF